MANIVPFMFETKFITHTQIIKTISNEYMIL